MQKMKEKPKKSCLSGCLKVVGGGIGLILFLLVLVCGTYLMLRAAGAYLIYSDELEPADAIVVLSGGTESRMTEALTLYKDDYAHIIVLTETGEPLEGYDYLNSFDMRVQLMNNGVPSGNILITDLSVNTTLDEAVAIRELLKNHQFSSAIIVTDPYHTRRTALLFNQVFTDTSIKIIIHPVRASWFNSRTWFLHKSGWQFTVTEYLKLVSMKLGIDE